MPKHCENAQRVAEWLLAREDVAWVNYPGLKENKYHALAEKIYAGRKLRRDLFWIKGAEDRRQESSWTN